MQRGSLLAGWSPSLDSEIIHHTGTDTEAGAQLEHARESPLAGTRQVPLLPLFQVRKQRHRKVDDLVKVTG